ncbi:MAG: hypothetical protein Q8R76_12850 [Candidatus Omnitrophota bacterium]|nr:hypothetical protein [Candidatus Omnitrophota bacterium]
MITRLYSRRKKNEAGFSLVEVMISIPIVVLALLGILYSNTVIQQSSEAAFERTVATQDAHRIIEQIRDQAVDGVFPANVTAQFPDGGEGAGFDSLEDEAIVVAYADATANPLDVSVTVTWQDQHGRAMDITLRTLVTQRVNS